MLSYMNLDTEDGGEIRLNGQPEECFLIASQLNNIS